MTTSIDTYGSRLTAWRLGDQLARAIGWSIRVPDYIHTHTVGSRYEWYGNCVTRAMIAALRTLLECHHHSVTSWHYIHHDELICIYAKGRGSSGGLYIYRTVDWRPGNHACFHPTIIGSVRCIQATVLFSHTKSAPTSQQYFYLTTNQYQPPATAQRTE